MSLKIQTWLKLLQIVFIYLTESVSGFFRHISEAAARETERKYLTNEFLYKERFTVRGAQKHREVFNKTLPLCHSFSIDVEHIGLFIYCYHFRKYPFCAGVRRTRTERSTCSSVYLMEFSEIIFFLWMNELINSLKCSILFYKSIQYLHNEKFFFSWICSFKMLRKFFTCEMSHVVKFIASC